MSSAKPSLKEKLIEELKKMLFVAVYFLIGFNLIALLLLLLTPYEGSRAAVFSSQSLMALVVAKVVVVADGLVAKRIQRTGSFLHAIGRKSVLYTFIILVALAIEAIIHQRLGSAASWSEAVRGALAESTGPRFVARTIYLLVLFCFYSFLSELNPYFSPHTLSDVVLSRFSKAERSRAVVLRFGLLQNGTELSTTTRLNLLDSLYAKIETRVMETGGQLELFGSVRGIAIWNSSENFRREDAQNIYDYFSTELAQLQSATGGPYQAKAVVAQGELFTYEAHGRQHREIVREGIALEQANQVFEELKSPELIFCPQVDDEASA